SSRCVAHVVRKSGCDRSLGSLRNGIHRHRRRPHALCAARSRALELATHFVARLLYIPHGRCAVHHRMAPVACTGIHVVGCSASSWSCTGHPRRKLCCCGCVSNRSISIPVLRLPPRPCFRAVAAYFSAGNLLAARLSFGNVLLSTRSCGRLAVVPARIARLHSMASGPLLRQYFPFARGVSPSLPGFCDARSRRLDLLL